MPKRSFRCFQSKRRIKSQKQNSFQSVRIRFEKLEDRSLFASDIVLDYNVPLDSIVNPAPIASIASTPVAKIINGTVTSDFAAVAQVGYRFGSSSEFIGSGVLIAPQYVLTAAHVAVEAQGVPGRVQFGSTVYNATEIFVHPNYNEAQFGEDGANDIAIYRLDAPITTITPVPIARLAPAVGSLMTLVGFGGAGTGQTGHDSSYGTKRVGTTTLEEVTSTLLRWTFDVNSTESNTAPGDSGGPSFITVNGQMVVAGVTSGGTLDSAGWGDESYNTRVDAYQTWIDEVMNPAATTNVVEYTTSGSVYTQNFNTMASSGTSSSLPSGWHLSESGANANTTYTAGTGSGSGGDTYSFGAASTSERALGTLQSGSLIPTVGAAIQNLTGAAISSFTIGYTGEQWRLGTAGRSDRLDFQYSLDATSLTTGNWVNVDALDFSSLVTTGTLGALDGNAASNRASRTATINSVNIANQATVWIRWQDSNASGADDGLAIDDFTFTAGTASTNTAPTISVIADQNTPFQTAISPIAFTVGDAETAAASLIVSAASSNTTLIPLSGILLAGTGTNRTVAIVPAAGQSGTSTITVTVSDGSLSTSRTFTVTVVSGITQTSTLRFVNYNIAASGSQGVRNGISTVLAGIGNEIVNGISRPLDLIALQEVESQATTSSIVASALNTLYSTTSYVSGTLDGLQLSGSGVDFGMTQGVVYNSSTLVLLSEVALGSPSTSGIVRQVMRYLFRPVGTTGSADFYMYNSHYKAVDDSESRQRREVEATLIRNDADALGEGRNIIYTGDFNTYSSTEAGYQKLLSTGAGQAFDPINRPGSWSGNSSYRDIFTQSPALNPANNLGLVGGGIDDRFDFQLVTGELLDQVGLDILPSNYRSFGINGSLPVSAAINDSRNTALQGLPNRTAVLNALAVVSDHLPVIADYSFTTVVPNLAPTDMAISNLALNENLPVASAVGVLSTSDPNASDTFTYSFVSGAGSTDNASFMLDGATLRTAAALDFETKSSYSVRIRTTDQGGLTYEEAFTISVLDLPELVGSVAVGSGTIQRSMVNQLQVTFDGAITIGSGAFSVTKQGTNGGPVTTAWTTSTNGSGQTVVTLTFTGSLTRGTFNSLSDGSYILSIDGTKITRAGRGLDANKDGVSGDSYSFGNDQAVDKFFALYGDTNGDGLVNVVDRAAFSFVFLQSSRYRADLDFNGDGVINVVDRVSFTANFLNSSS